MPNNDKEVYKILGGLEASLKAQDRTLAVVESMTNKINDNMILMNGRVGKAHDRIDALEEEAVTKKDVMKTALAVSTVGGLSVSGIFAAIKAYLGIA